ncbi:hypothetical protein C8Q70DRAFT_1053281 [Cubamyces menziesii]|uniref:Uncharacterized protein n=1 Tax=Trametes cubensis TaxID=1111947 RepID=A0AAD7XG40_9APHY|nr:hypothetical protein C8Q70DRAFT_1053281 [Cubamyces menziesii]KAJ8496376.1 hypothetical protein ONZ51_g1173 [Trametes cubensis]
MCAPDSGTHISRVPLIAGDAIVILVTWWKTYKLKKAADEARVTTSLVDLLLRDGSIYFGTMLVLNSLHIMMNHVAKVSFVGDVAYVVTSILISRFIMNLRDIDTGGPGSRSTGYEPGGPGSWHAMTQRSAGGGHGDTVVFANDFVGSMGGTLERSMWAQSRFHTPEPAGVIREDAETGSPVGRESGKKRSRQGASGTG